MEFRMIPCMCYCLRFFSCAELIIFNVFRLSENFDWISVYQYEFVVISCSFQHTEHTEWYCHAFCPMYPSHSWCVDYYVFNIFLQLPLGSCCVLALFLGKGLLLSCVTKNSYKDNSMLYSTIELIRVWICVRPHSKGECLWLMLQKLYTSCFCQIM